MSTNQQRRAGAPKPGSASQRGRAVKQSSSRRGLYIVLAGVAVVALVLVGAFLFRPGAGANVAEELLATLPSKGSAEAPVTVVEYSDFQCPACGYYFAQMSSDIDATYVDAGKVRIIYHDFPLNQHRNAIPAAEAARAANEQGKFWEMHDLLFRQQYEWSELVDPTAQFVAYAGALGLDTATFEEALRSGKFRQDVLKTKQAAESANIPATPTFVIDGKQYSMENLKQGIEDALAGK